MQLRYAIADIGSGWIGILGSDSGLRRTTLPQPSPREAQHRLGSSTNDTDWSPDFFHHLVERLRAYFKGQEVVFSEELDLSGATQFQRLVWEKAKLIPYGETRSYAWIAEQINQPAAARAVGQALGRNPLPVIIPCHRVITADGKLGGYSGGLGVKRSLLQLEASGRTS